ncbi:MAG: BPSS1780 family membrane protein [Bacteroidia bacterium]|nr:BPSS1780 family membrane protein [Bacteroidia bacterium]
MSDSTRFDHLAQSGYEFKLGDYLSRGWELFRSQMGSFIGYTLLMGVIYFVSALVLAFIPGIGGIAAGILLMTMLAGFYIGCETLAKTGTVSMNDFFRGFEVISQVALYYLILIGIVLVVFGVLGGGLFLIKGQEVIESFQDLQTQQDNPLAALEFIQSLGWFIAFFVLAGIALQLFYYFALPLIALGRLSAWPAMETSRKVATPQLLQLFLFVIVLGLINLAGALLLLVGLIFTIPLTLCSIYAAYEGIFGIEGSGPESQIDEIGRAEG